MSRLAMLPLLALSALLPATACRSGDRPPESAAAATGPGATAPAATAPAGEGLVLQESEGERRVRRGRPGSTLTAPFILKVDPKNGGSTQLTMGYEDIPPGQAIPPHHHPSADEILFVHRGSGTASLGTRTVPVTSGATIYIPRNTRISLRNTGAAPLSIAFIFSRPGFEEYLRETSVPEGAPAPPLSPEELVAIRARHTNQAIYEHP